MIPVYRPFIGEQESNYVAQAVASTWISAKGEFLDRFEREFPRFVDSTYGIATCNGTAAAHLALAALGIGPGDEVIVPTLTYVASVNAISYTGATPVFVDSEPDYWNLDPALLEAAVSERTKAIEVVHLYGHPTDMDPVLEVARRYGLAVLEDAAEAHGAEYKGRRVGGIGDMGCFSFYPGKNLGAYGEAGGVVTNDPQLADRIKRLRDHGQSRKYYHEMIGTNGRMDGIQGAILSVKLKHLDSWNEARRKHAISYRHLLEDVPSVQIPREMRYARHIYHVFAVRVPGRDRLMEALGESGIACGVHYPVPIHLQQAYANRGEGAGSFPVAERCALEFLSLPMFPELSEEQIAFVGQELGRLAKAPGRAR